MATTVRPKVQLTQIEDYTGGLNLRADQFQLKDNESPEILNFDIDPRGGIRTRRGVVNLHDTPLGSAPLGFMKLTTISGTQQLLTVSGTTVFYSTGSNWTTTGITVAGRSRGQTFVDRIYIQDGVNAVKSWTGAAAATLGVAYSPDIDAPTSGNMPKAKLIVAHNNHLFIANTLEGATSFPNRVRFSHPGKAEAWRDIDYFDVTPDDGDQITGLLPFRDHLIIFKHRSVYALYGVDFNDFSLLPITHTTGAPTQEAVTASPSTAYWWSNADGLFSYNGSQVFYLFEPLRPAIQDGTITTFNAVVAGFYEGKVYLGVPWLSGRSTLVFDPSLNGGAWTRFDLPVTDMMTWFRIDGSDLFVGWLTSRLYMFQMEKPGQTFDQFAPATVTPIAAHWYSRWLDAHLAAAKKRWKRPNIVSVASASTDVNLDLYEDFNNVQRKRRTLITLTGLGTASVWGTAVWGTATWGGDGARHDFDRTSTLGTSHAVQLRLFSTGTTTSWGVDSITIPFITKRLR